MADPPRGSLHFRAARAILVLGQGRTWLPLLATTVLTATGIWAETPMVGTIGLLAGLAFALGRAGMAAFSHHYAARAIGPPGPPLHPDVPPCDIRPAELRTSYDLILRAHEEIRRHLATNDRLVERLQPLYDYCGELAQSAGRIAATANRVDAYLERMDVEAMKRAAQRLERCARQTNDRSLHGMLRTAAVARRRHLSNLRQLCRIYQRIQARLEMVLASLENVVAMVVKMQALDGEQVALANGCIVEQLDLLAEDERIIEAAMGEATGELAPSATAAVATP